MNSTRKWQNGQHCCHGSHSGVRGGSSLRGAVKSDGDIQSVLAVFLPSAQTFINITSQPSEKPTSDLERQRKEQAKLKSINLHFSRSDSKTNKQKKSLSHDCTYMDGLLASARNWTVRLWMVVVPCVHVNVHLHFIIQDLHKLLHGGQVTWLQFGPHWYIYKRIFSF